MKLHIVGNKDTVPALVERLVTQLNAVFPEVDERDFPIEFVVGGKYNGSARSGHDFTSLADFEAHCEGKSQRALDAITFVSIADAKYRNLGSVTAELAERAREPQDGNIIITHGSYVSLVRDKKPVLHTLGKGDVDTLCTSYPEGRALLLACPNEVSVNNAKSVAFAVASHLLIPEYATLETVFCDRETKKGKCIMYGSLREGMPRSQRVWNERAFDFCEPCVEKLVVAARQYS